jgi:hypothetical protein
MEDTGMNRIKVQFNHRVVTLSRNPKIMYILSFTQLAQYEGSLTLSGIKHIPSQN